MADGLTAGAPAAKNARPTVSRSAPGGRFAPGGRLAPLGYRDFRLVFFGQVISAVGSWMQLVAQGWLVYELSDSAFYLGLVGLARAVPGLFLTLVGGAAADRYNRKTIMAISNGVVAVNMLVLSALCFTGAIAVWHVIVIAFLSGTAFAFEVPSRQSLVSSIVEPRDVVGALSLMSVAFNTAQVVGPALAAILIEWSGEGPVFLLNGLSYCSVVVAAMVIQPRAQVAASRGNILANVVEGLGYVRRTPELFALAASMAAVAFLARPFTQLLPAFARDVLGAGAAGLGALNSAAGVGALLGAVLSAGLGSYRGRGFALLASAALFGVALALFGLSTDLAISVGVAGAIGLLSAFSGINSNTMLQSHSDARMRGRVISLHGLTMMGVVPLGVMFEGALGSLIGVPMTVVVGGIGSALVATWALLAFPKVRSMD
ncbi:MAG: MFS transporter [Chloroflexi bacterium]|nr:MFS transporter [Chloroflexota bacterium]